MIVFECIFICLYVLVFICVPSSILCTSCILCIYMREYKNTDIMSFLHYTGRCMHSLYIDDHVVAKFLSIFMKILIMSIVIVPI